MSEKNKHMSLHDRLEIELGLKNKLSFKEIAKIINKDCTTVSKEIRSHLKIENRGAQGREFNDCLYRKKCEFRDPGVKCNRKICSHYICEQCQKITKPPYVCNGCDDRLKCTLTKHIYEAVYAYNEYTDLKKESREGVTYSELEIETLNQILYHLIAEQGQSIHHAVCNNKNVIMCSEKEIYNLIDNDVLSIKNIDLPRKVRYRQRKKRKTYYKIDKNCLNGRRFQDFLKYIEENPDTAVVEMDTVEGVKGGKVLLTIHFVSSHFMIAFIRNHNDAQSVIDAFNLIEDIVGLETFRKLFPVILTDNGSEFSNPSEIETNRNGEIRTKIFYCEPGRSDQKGACEVNHEFIRKVIPQGDSLDTFDQEKINLLMSHINSYKRKKLNDCSPIQLFNLMFGNEFAENFGIIEIKPNDINLTKNLLK